jgi:hypothetical protein
VGRDATLRTELGARGREHVWKFSLEQLGEETLAIYRDAAEA